MKIGKPKKNERGLIKMKKINKRLKNKENGITLIALVITIVLNFSYLEMARMNKFEKI